MKLASVLPQFMNGKNNVMGSFISCCQCAYWVACGPAKLEAGQGKSTFRLVFSRFYTPIPWSWQHTKMQLVLLQERHRDTMFIAVVDTSRIFQGTVATFGGLLIFGGIRDLPSCPLSRHF